MPQCTSVVLGSPAQAVGAGIVPVGDLAVAAASGIVVAAGKAGMGIGAAAAGSAFAVVRIAVVALAVLPVGTRCHRKVLLTVGVAAEPSPGRTGVVRGL